MIDLKGFREDKGVEDYYKSSFDLNSEEGDIEWFVDNLEDAIKWLEMKKGETKEVGTVSAYCVDNIINKVDGTFDDSDEFEGEILIMLTYDEYPDDTIKIRFKIAAALEDDQLWVEDQSTYYLDSEGQENPLNYSNFLELYQFLDDLA